MKNKTKDDNLNSKKITIKYLRMKAEKTKRHKMLHMTAISFNI